ncbi:MAG TPA: hypothetical protein PLC09_02880 [Holophaga sp.]|jgi:nitrate reductase gamma subunit|nr:hypothetical protein [Holophaga sp.]
MPLLKLAVLLAAVASAAALVAQALRAQGYGPRRRFAPPAGKAGDGVRYAFTGALSPRAKESAREHPLAWAAGMVFHGGVFTGLLTLALALVGPQLPSLVAVPLGLVCGLGGLCGMGLLAKRLLQPELRALSRLDDWISNLLATTLPLLALGWLASPRLEAAFFSGALALLVYAPFGKLRHAVFFFLSRRHLGAFFGRRGTFPVRHA